MKRLIRMITIAIAALLPTSVIVLGPGSVSSASSHATVAAAIPLPVQEALTVVAASRGSGPLTVDTTVGSVAGDVWTSTTESQSAGVAQHWSLEASDSSGTIVLGIMVTDGGTEAVSAWVPGTSQVSNWVFNTSNDSPTAIYQVTVPSTTGTISLQHSTNSGPTPNAGYGCGITVATPYAYSGTIFYSGSAICNVDAALLDVLNLWDYYNSSSYSIVATTTSAGVTVDYVTGHTTCYPGFAPRNSFHAELITTVTAPPGFYPAVQTIFWNSPSVNLPCTNA